MTSAICCCVRKCDFNLFIRPPECTYTAQWKGIWFWLKWRAVSCWSSYSWWVFSQPRSLCLLSQCCAITLQMNHLPLWVHCFWPGYLLHQHGSCSNLNPHLSPPPSAPPGCNRHSLSLHPSHLALRFKSNRWRRTNKSPVSFLKTQQCQRERLLFTWHLKRQSEVSFCWGEWLMNA